MSEAEIESSLQKLQSLNLKDINTTSLIDNLVNWLLSSGIRLIIGLIILSVGFKITKKVVNKLDKVLEKREVDVTFRRFLKSLSSGALKTILVLLVVTLLWDIKLTGLVNSPCICVTTASIDALKVVLAASLLARSPSI